eukprot:scaffold20649_cov113-Isochrysis_galbana.AAC.4
MSSSHRARGAALPTRRSLRNSSAHSAATVDASSGEAWVLDEWCTLTTWMPASREMSGGRAASWDGGGRCASASEREAVDGWARRQPESARGRCPARGAPSARRGAGSRGTTGRSRPGGHPRTARAAASGLPGARGCASFARRQPSWRGAAGPPHRRRAYPASHATRRWRTPMSSHPPIARPLRAAHSVGAPRAHALDVRLVTPNLERAGWRAVGGQHLERLGKKVVDSCVRVREHAHAPPGPDQCGGRPRPHKRLAGARRALDAQVVGFQLEHRRRDPLGRLSLARVGRPLRGRMRHGRPRPQGHGWPAEQEAAERTRPVGRQGELTHDGSHGGWDGRRVDKLARQHAYERRWLLPALQLVEACCAGLGHERGRDAKPWRVEVGAAAQLHGVAPRRLRGLLLKGSASVRESRPSVRSSSTRASAGALSQSNLRHQPGLASRLWKQRRAESVSRTASFANGLPSGHGPGALSRSCSRETSRTSSAARSAAAAARSLGGSAQAVASAPHGARRAASGALHRSFHRKSASWRVEMQSSRLYSSRLARTAEWAVSCPSGCSSHASYTTTDWSPLTTAVPRPVPPGSSVARCPCQAAALPGQPHTSRPARWTAAARPPPPRASRGAS